MSSKPENQALPSQETPYQQLSDSQSQFAQTSSQPALSNNLPSKTEDSQKLNQEASQSSNAQEFKQKDPEEIHKSQDLANQGPQASPIDPSQNGNLGDPNQNYSVPLLGNDASIPIEPDQSQVFDKKKVILEHEVQKSLDTSVGYGWVFLIGALISIGINIYWLFNVRKIEGSNHRKKWTSVLLILLASNLATIGAAYLCFQAKKTMQIKYVLWSLLVVILAFIIALTAAGIAENGVILAQSLVLGFLQKQAFCYKKMREWEKYKKDENIQQQQDQQEIVKQKQGQ